MRRVVVIASHPDDEVLGPGGTVVKHVEAGDEVRAIVLSEGASSRYADGAAEDLRSAGRRCAQVLGLSTIDFLDLPDQRLDTMPLIEITQRLEEAIHAYQPNVVYTHAPRDVNTDHGVTARAAWTACRPYSTPYVELFACFDTASSTEWSWPGFEAPFEPNHYVDVTATLDRKLDAMSCYQTELREYPHPRSLRSLAERAAFWGSRVGVSAAEPFMVLRSRA